MFKSIKKSYVQLNHKIKTTDLGRGIVYNLISMTLIAIFGMLTNIFIASKYGSSILGNFNHQMAYYIVLSQLCVMGIHSAILKYIPQADSEIDMRDIVSSALFICVLNAIVVSLIIVIFISTLAFFDIISNSYSEIVILAQLSALFFSINKVGLSVFNARNKMGTYAFFNALRFVVVFMLSLLITNKKNILYILPISEVMLLIVVCLKLWKNSYLGTISIDKIKKLYTFGFKIMGSYLAIEINTRVDVMIIGLICMDSNVGIYSFALLFAEVCIQVLVVIRNNLVPIISKSFKTNDTCILLRDYYKLKRKLEISFLFICVFSIVAYKLLLIAKIIGNEFSEGLSVLLILNFFVFNRMHYFILANLLSLAGFPSVESKINIITVMLNVILNFSLIPVWGINGAALATGVSYILNGNIINYYTKLKINLKIPGIFSWN